MIQRIQSLQLVVALAFLVLLFIFPYAVFIDPQAVNHLFDFTGVHASENTGTAVNILPLQILTGVVPVITLGTLFLFKNRVLQMRLCVFNMLLMIGILILMAWYIYYIKTELSAQVYYKATLLAPLLALVFTWLAFRNIRKDELLVRSVDRIR